MKVIINGRRYDTETAILIGEARSRGYTLVDLSSWLCGLYKTPRGEAYFLAGEGGFMTRFHSRSIIPITRDEALTWARQYLKPKQIKTMETNQ